MGFDTLPNRDLVQHKCIVYEYVAVVQMLCRNAKCFEQNLNGN